MDDVTQKRAEALRRNILEQTEAYFKLVHEPGAFTPGESRLPIAGRVFDANEGVLLVDSALEFWLTEGRYTKRFEACLSDYLGVSHVLFVNSGSSANLLAFTALTSPLLGDRRIQRGDEIITAAAAFPTTVSPIIQLGAVPVFVDVVPETLNIDIPALDRALGPKTKGVMLAHTLGNPFDVAAVKAFCDANHLWLVEDNCDALGARFSGRLTGTFGDLGTSSFYPAHHITTGEGGAVYTDNPLLWRILRSLRDWGRDCTCASGHDNTCQNRFGGGHGRLPKGYDHKYVYSHFGYNLKATDLQAAIGIAQLDKLDMFTAVRAHNYQFLEERLAHLGGAFLFPKVDVRARPSWFGFPLVIRDNSRFSRNDITRYLEDAGIQTRVLFGGNLVLQPCFSALTEGRDYRVAGTLPGTDKLMTDCFWIGVYPGMTDKKLSYVTTIIEQFVQTRATVVPQQNDAVSKEPSVSF